LSSQQVNDLRAKARRAREMASRLVTDEQAVKNLTSYADDLEGQAHRLESELKIAQIAEQPQGQEPGNGPEAAAALIPKAQEESANPHTPEDSEDPPTSGS
jgi:hypothetical protein